MAKHYVVTFDDAIRGHDIALQAGGRKGIPRPQDVLSALGRPYSGYYRSIDRKAAALLDAVANNHGFADANKRTAILLTVLLIEKSGYDLVPIGGERLGQAFADFVVALVEGEAGLDDAAKWFKARLRRSP